MITRVYHYTTFILVRHVLNWWDNTCLVCWESTVSIVNPVLTCGGGAGGGGDGGAPGGGGGRVGEVVVVTQVLPLTY